MSREKEGRQINQGIRTYQTGSLRGKVRTSFVPVLLILGTPNLEGSTERMLEFARYQVPKTISYIHENTSPYLELAENHFFPRNRQ